MFVFDKNRVVSAVVLLTVASVASGELISDFQDGTTQGWRTGVASANQPMVVPTGGPLGVGDAYLSLLSDGGGAADGRLVVHNLSSPWVGNLAAEGWVGLALDLRNFGIEDLQIRVVVQGAGGDYISTQFVDLPAGGGWTHGDVSLRPVDMAAGTGSPAGSPGTDYNATLSNVTRVWLIHNTTADFPPPFIEAEIGLDNIAAIIPEPSGLLILAIGSVCAVGRVGRQRG